MCIYLYGYWVGVYSRAHTYVCVFEQQNKPGVIMQLSQLSTVCQAVVTTHAYIIE